MIRNYAAQLVVGDALRAYGVDADIEGFVLAALIDHLRTLREDGTNVAEAFVRDLVTRLGAGDRAAQGSCDVNAEGIHINVENALKALQAKGYTYDVSDPRTVSRLLRQKGIADDKPDRHYFRGCRLRSVLIPHATLSSLGLRVLRNDRRA